VTNLKVSALDHKTNTHTHTEKKKHPPTKPRGTLQKTWNNSCTFQES